MLTRIAQSLFWIGRYVERADVTARILDVQNQLLVEDPFLGEEESCRLLLGTMGVPLEGLDSALQPGEGLTQRTMLRLMVDDFNTEVSVLATLSAARESARRARETLSTEMWQAINTTWRAIASGRIRAMRRDDAFAWVRERSALISGIADATMSRDQGWHFLVLGRNLERADMTARLLTTTSLAGAPSGGWQAALRACGAHEAFLRTYRGLETDREAAEFLLLDRLFPRSVMWALTAVERSLNDLESAHQRAGFHDEALRLVGRARADLEYRPLAEVLLDVPGEMRALQLVCSKAAEAVSSRYFDTTEAVSWAGGGR